MRIAILVYPMSGSAHLTNLASALADGITQQGHFVEILNLSGNDDIRPTRFEYVCVGVESTSFFSSTLPPDFYRRFEKLSGIAGKRSFAFVPKKSLSPDRFLTNLMKLMESQGMFLRNSAVLASPADAKLMGQMLEVLRQA